MTWLIIPLMAVLHRFRGAVGWPYRLANVLVAAILLMALWAVGASPWVQAAWSLGYLLWSLPSWARWASLGHTTPAYGEGRALYWDERLIEEFNPGGTAYGGLIVRFWFWLLPLCFALDFLGVQWIWLLLVPASAVPAYWLGWRISTTDPFKFAEPIVGLAWGCAIWMAL